MRQRQLLGSPADSVAGRRLVSGLLERAARAVPATVEQVRAGCRLRATDCTATWWAGAALLHDPPGDTEAAVDEAERFAAAQGVSCLVQVCPGCPPDLHAVLDHRGYAHVDEVSLRVAPAHVVASRGALAPGLRTREGDVADHGWFEVAASALPPDVDRGPERVLLTRVGAPSAYVTVDDGSGAIAVGRGVLVDGWAGVFSMTTRPEARRRGAGRAVLGALAVWALRQGVGQMYLQVERDNRAAALYASAGFVELCRYHYRRSPPLPSEVGTATGTGPGRAS